MHKHTFPGYLMHPDPRLIQVHMQSFFPCSELTVQKIAPLPKSNCLSEKTSQSNDFSEKGAPSLGTLPVEKTIGGAEKRSIFRTLFFPAIQSASIVFDLWYPK